MFNRFRILNKKIPPGRKSVVKMLFLLVTYMYVFSSPAATAVISLAFGRYILEPFFIQCEIPELAIKLITAVGISEYGSYKYF